MKIAILDQENARVIVAMVPDYLEDANASSDDIASAIMTALGISTDTEYMMGEFEAHCSTRTLTATLGSMGLEEFTQDFKTDALEALADLTD